MILKWLRDCGFKYCSRCQTVKCADEFSPKSPACRPCTALRIKQGYWSNEKIRAIQRKHVKKQTDSGYFKEYYGSPEVRQRIRDRDRVRYEQRRSDPQQLEKMRAKWRRNYENQKAKKTQTGAAECPLSSSF